MRIVHQLECDFGASEACKAAGITENRLFVWLTRGAFRSDEDLAGARGPRDPRRFSGNDVLRMRLLAQLSDAGASIADATRVVDLFVGSRQELHPPFVVLLRTSEGLEVRPAANTNEVQRILFPNGPVGWYPFASVLAVDAIRGTLFDAIESIESERTKKHMGYMAREGATV